MKLILFKLLIDKGMGKNELLLTAGLLESRIFTFRGEQVMVDRDLAEESPLRAPEEILAEMEVLDAETNEILQSIKALI